MKKIIFAITLVSITTLLHAGFDVTCSTDPYGTEISVGINLADNSIFFQDGLKLKQDGTLVAMNREFSYQIMDWYTDSTLASNVAFLIDSTPHEIFFVVPKNVLDMNKVSFVGTLTYYDMQQDYPEKFKDEQFYCKFL